MNKGEPRRITLTGTDSPDSSLSTALLYAVTDVMVGGRHVVKDGHHADEQKAAERFAATVNRLQSDL